jgi:hypothetical protein
VKRFIGRGSRRTALVAVVGLAVTGGVAYASVPDQSGDAQGSTAQSGTSLYACVTQRFHTLNLVGARTPCPAGQQKISLLSPGPPGPRGKTGKPGPRGKTGRPGPRGSVGVRGAAGPAGPAGAMGHPGPSGHVGEKGAVGPTGPTGHAGAKGEVGPVGPVGARGEVGPAGAKGAKGEVGPAGAKGAKGDVGHPGPAGAMGPQGPAGLATGVQGSSTTAVRVPGRRDTVLAAPAVPKSGTYYVTAPMTLRLGSGDKVFCKLSPNQIGNVDQAVGQAPQDEYFSITVGGAVSLTAGQKPSVTCFSEEDDPSTLFIEGAITAVLIDSSH